ncbi:MAG TPA: PKD domain-containing protein [Thermoplasmata archaeon]|nr:PKD domain-containing protein [Thermoplasmata archaeon]
MRSAAGYDPLGKVGYTWDLTNNTAYPSSFVPPLHWEPSALAVISSTGKLWVAWGPSPFHLSDNISVVNLSTNLVVGELPGTSNATGLLYEPGLGLVFVTRTINAGGFGQLLILNATTGAVVGGPTLLGQRPSGMAYDSYDHLLYVLSSGSDMASSISVPSGTYVNPFIPVGSAPSAAAYTSVSGDVYVANYGSDNVTVLNGSTGQPSGPSISFPNFVQPFQIIESPQTGDLIVAFRGDSAGGPAIGVIDPTINAPVNGLEMQSPGVPSSAELDPSTGLIIMPLGGVVGYGNGLIFYNPLTNSYAIPSNLYSVYFTNASVEAIDAQSGFDYIAHAFAPNDPGPAYLTTVNLSTPYSAGPIVLLGASARGGTYDPSDGKVWIADSFTSSIYLSQPDTLAAIDVRGGPVSTTVPVGPNGPRVQDYAPESVGLDPLTNELVVANGDGGPGVVLRNASTGAYITEVLSDLHYLLLTAPFPNDTDAGASQVVYDAAHQRIYVADPFGGIAGFYASNFTIFWGNRSWTPSPFSPGLSYPQPLPYATLALSPSNGFLYAVAPDGLSSRGRSLTVYDPFASGPSAPGGVNDPGGATLGATGTGVGSGAVFDPLDGDLYVSDSRANVVYVLNLSSPLAPTNVETIPVGKDPVALTFDPMFGDIVVANYASANLTVLNGSTAAAGLVGAFSIPVAPGPAALVLDPAQDALLVSTEELGLVQAVSPFPVLYSYAVSRNFTDVGVPITLHAIATEGTGAYQYSYTGLPPGCTSQDTPNLVCAPNGTGTFTIGLTVADQGPSTASGTVELRVTADPSIQITDSAPAVDVGLLFSASSVATNGTPPLSFEWEFGDGSTAVNGSTAEHVYRSPGVYLAEAVVTDALGFTASASARLLVGAQLGSTLAGPPTGSEGSPVSFNGSADQGVPPYRFSWTFGDGTSVVTGVVGSSRGNSSDVSHTYSTTGTFHLTVLISDGSEEQVLSQGNVTIGPPVLGPSSPGTPGAPVPLAQHLLPVAFLAGDLIAAAGLMALLWYRRRERRTPA